MVHGERTTVRCDAERGGRSAPEPQLHGRSSGRHERPVSVGHLSPKDGVGDSPVYRGILQGRPLSGSEKKRRWQCKDTSDPSRG